MAVLSCENDVIRLNYRRGYEPSLESSILCQDVETREKELQCLPATCNSKKKELENCEVNVLLLGGGTEDESKFK